MRRRINRRRRQWVHVVVDDEVQTPLLRIAVLGVLGNVLDHALQRNGVKGQLVNLDAVEFAVDGLPALASVNHVGPDQRVRHTYVIGASGTGKSTLLLSMIVQDIQNGEGVAVLDPHGDLIDKILGHVPEDRINDVILMDPSDERYPVGFNILSARSELEKNVLASDLVSIFRRLSTSWGDQMTSVLGNAILAFLESSEGGTLADLRRFLVEADFRNRYLTTVRDEEVVYYWR